MSADLDLRIRQAMIELAEAAPSPRPIDRLPAPAGDHGHRRILVAALVGVAAIGAVSIVAAVSGRSGHQTIRSGTVASDPAPDTASTPPASTSDVPPITAPPITTPSITGPPITGPPITGPPITVAPMPEPSPAPTGATLAPIGPLPDGLQVWDLVVHRATADAGSSAQLFGTMTPDGTRIERGLLIRATPSGGSGVGDGVPIVDLRGLQAGEWDPETTDVDFRWRWFENGYAVEATGRGITRGDAIEMLDNLTWRPDSAGAPAGFDPASTAPDLPLVAEQTPPAGKTLELAEYVLARSATDLPTYGTVGARAFAIQIATGPYVVPVPEIIFRGTRLASGFTLCDACQSGSLPAAAGPDGQVVLGFSSLDGAQREQLLAALRTPTSGELDDLITATADRQASLPLSRSAVTGKYTVEQRGEDGTNPIFACLVLGTERRCHIVFAVDNSSTLVLSVIVGRQWAIATISDANGRVVAVTPNAASTAPFAREQTVTDRRWSVTTIRSSTELVAVDDGVGDHFPDHAVYTRPLDRLSASPAATAGNPYVTANASDAGGIVTIDRGATDGIRLGMSVVNDDGLVGRIIEVTGSSSTLRLVTDSMFAVECDSVPTAGDRLLGCLGLGAGRGMTVLAADGGGLPPTVATGVEIRTSGSPTSLAPGGLRIGRMRNGVVEPAADLGHLAEVQVVLYQPSAGG